MNPITPAELAAYFDHTQLRAYAQRKDFEKLCAEAREYGFAMDTDDAVDLMQSPMARMRSIMLSTLRS